MRVVHDLTAVLFVELPQMLSISLKISSELFLNSELRQRHVLLRCIVQSSIVSVNNELGAVPHNVGVVFGTAGRRLATQYTADRPQLGDEMTAELVGGTPGRRVLSQPLYLIH